MKWIQEWPFLYAFVPNHRKPVDPHILGDEASRTLILETEKLLAKIVEQSLGKNLRKTIRRQHKERKIVVRMSQKRIRIMMIDTKFSKAAVRKRIYIDAFRKYVKAKDGVGKLKEATIHYLKDGRSHVRSIRQVPLFQGVFYQLNRLDEAYLGLQSPNEPPMSLISTQQLQKDANQSNMQLLHRETERYIGQLRHFSLDPLLESRLNRIVGQTEKLIPDFELLDYEERHTVRRMLREDIPKLLNTYLSLSTEHQLAQKENVFVSLSKMELRLIELNEQLEKSRIERMEHLLRLNELRYDK